LPASALSNYGAEVNDARGNEVTGNHPDAIAAANDFAARLLRLDQGLEDILDAAMRWPQTPILRLYAAAFWLYGQTGEALENAAAELRACEALAMNSREHALHRALTLWHADDYLGFVERARAAGVTIPILPPLQACHSQNLGRSARHAYLS
jgi:hypothetical protein